MFLVSFRRRNQPATLDMLQNKIVSVQTVVVKIWLSPLLVNFYSNTALFEFEHGKSDVQLLSWLKVKFIEDFAPVLSGFFQRWINNTLKVIRVIFSLYFLLYSIVRYYTQFNETLWVHGGSNPLENPWTSNTKTVMTCVFRKIKSRRQHVLFSFLTN